MANPKYAEITIPLDGGLDERSAPERVAPDSLTTQSNTRLSVRPGTPIKAPGSVVVNPFIPLTGSPPVHGMVAANNSVLACFDPAEGQKRILYEQVSGVISTADDVATRQNRYIATQISRSQAVCGEFTTGLPAVTLDGLGNTWLAYVRRFNNTNDGYMFVTVFGPDNETLVASRRVSLITNGLVTTPWVGVTYQSTSGVSLWYRDDTAGGAFKIRGVSLNQLDGAGYDISLGSPTTLYTPVGLVRQPAVATDGVRYAYLFTRHATVNTQLRISRVDTTVPSVVGGATMTSANTIAQSLAVEHIPTLGGDRIMYAWSEGAGTTSGYGLLIASTMFSSFGAAGPAIAGLCACAPSITSNAAGDQWGVWAFSHVDGFVGTATNYARTELYSRRLDGTAGTTTKTVPWMRLYDSGCTWRKYAGSVLSTAFPVFGMARCYAAAALPTDVGFVEDPCVQAMLIVGGSTIELAPISRYGAGTGQGQDGVDLTGNVTLASVPGWSANSKSCFALGDRLISSYSQFRGYAAGVQNTGYVPILVETDLSGAGVKGIRDTRGGGILVASMPWYWDGAESTELCPTYRPKMYAVATGGTVNKTGTFAFRAVYTWRNAFGEVVRSAPSAAVTISPAGTAPRFWVSRPQSVRDGVLQAEVDVEIYIRDVSANSLYYLYRQAPVSRNQDGCWYYNAMLYGVYSDTTPTLFSTGDEGTQLLPNSPQPLWDAALVGKRVIGIDAETRTTVVVSKEKEVSIALEFATELNIPIDGGAGRLNAVSEVGGDAIVFADRGIYSVSGDGLDNLGHGNAFARPRIVSDLGCQDKMSVVRCPAGVLFRTVEDNVALLGSGGLTVFDKIQIDPARTIVGALVLPRQDEVMYLLDDGTAKALNYRLQRWSTWSNAAYANASGMAACEDGTALIYTASTGTFSRLYPETYDATQQMQFETGCLAPESDQGDCTFYELLWFADWQGTHGVTFEFAVDYGAYDAMLTRSWSAAELAAITGSVAGTNYTLSVGMQQTARAIRVRITETSATGEGMRPLSATLCYSTTARGHQRTVVMDDRAKK